MSITDYFARKGVIHIATTTLDGRELSTPIWGVLVDGVPYIRSGYGDTAAWYRRMRRTWRAAFIDGRQRYPVRIAPVADEATKRHVDDAYRSKYRGQGIALQQSIDSPARDYTLRIDLDVQPPSR